MLVHDTPPHTMHLPAGQHKQNQLLSRKLSTSKAVGNTVGYPNKQACKFLL
uniref:Uncharacterized protein n=1 Tax=Arundo donax TaxID=35708 RepID=A0A0A9E9P1_ARUDO